ncbi:hypothetical protein EPO05_05885, partial [Patescibacteria group bacterium]
MNKFTSLASLENKIYMLKFFAQFPEVLAVMSERQDGSMKLFDRDWKFNKQNEPNRHKFFEKIGVDYDEVVYAYLKNTNQVVVVDNAETRIIPGVDGLVTRRCGLYLGVTAADCIPVFFFEPERKIVALAHCGWRGIVSDIMESAVGKILELGGDPEKLHVALGPGINQCHFEIQTDVLGEFKDYPECIVQRDGKIFVDLKGILRQQLAVLNV